MTGDAGIPVGRYIDGIETDYEPEIKVPGLSTFEKYGIIARRVTGSANPQTNKVVRSIINGNVHRAIDDVFSFFGESRFSWMIGPDSKPDNLEEILHNCGMKADDTYYGMFREVEEPPENDSLKGLNIIEIRTYGQLEQLTDLLCSIWSVSDRKSRDNIFREKSRYLSMPGRRGSSFLALYGGIPAGYSNYRVSSDGNAMYLTGAGVRESYRKKGIYTGMVWHRLRVAYDMGCGIAVTKARETSSKPVLSKLGFREHGRYIEMLHEP